MTTTHPGTIRTNTKHALLLGGLGVLGFSLTLPATRVAVPVFGGWTVAFGRALPAALLGAMVLLARKQPLLPPWRALPQMLQVVAGVVVGFRCSPHSR
jgi:drug/metabolite transporter (DMT)-like permease